MERIFRTFFSYDFHDTNTILGWGRMRGLLVLWGFLLNLFFHTHFSSLS